MPRGLNPYDEARLQGRLWTPNVVRPALWLDASDLSTITVATGVSEWRDKSGNERNFSQGTSANQPDFTPNRLNGNPAVSFNGSQWLTSPAAASIWNFLHNTTGSTVFAIWQAGNNSNPNAFYTLMGNNGLASANIGFYIIYDDRLASARNDRMIILISRGVAGAQAVLNQTADNAHPANTPVLLTHFADPNNATASARSILQINQTVVTNNADTNAPSASNASFALQIGAGGNNSGPTTGYIAEILVFSGILNSLNRLKIQGYLAHKWGLRNALVAAHPFINRPPLIGD